MNYVIDHWSFDPFVIIVAVGTPEEIAGVAESATGACLRKILG